jgi:predicted ATPase/DNA-binding SARP family transcriptional activator
VDVLVLGPLEVRRDGEPVHVRRGRPRRLLLSLLLQQGGAVAPQTLIDQLWGDQQPVNADNALQLLVSHLRRVLAGTGARIERTAVGYRLVVDPEDVDAFCFERLVRAARAAVDPGKRFRLAAEASSLWRGAPLSEAADDDFAVADVVRLEELRLSAEELRLEALLALGGHDEALPDLDRAVRAWPYRERFAALHVLALYRAGRQADALAALGAARSVLAADLGLDPGPELRQLEERILRQDPELGPPVGAPLPGATTASAAAPAPPGPASAPAPLTALVGREEELAAVAHALADHRLVTLTGPGGTGKSRLAAEVARAETGPVWWCDLSGVTAGEQVPRAVATAAGTAGADPVQALRCSIGDRPVLLVLDTCEHVLPAVAELTGELTAACPALRVLASSRRPLGLPGEQVRPVPPLPLPGEGASADDVARSAAVRLFCERAAAVRPAFALDERNAADVARICRLLDGLPLALELAAATAAALSPASIADLLSDRLRLIGGEGGRGDRHAGLRATIGWSYGLLSAEEALFLDRLSVFAGPFAAEVAVEVAGAGLTGDGLELLLRLVGHSLVAVQGIDRFRLLDTVRAFAAERLAARGADEQRALRERHARWYLAFAREADAGIRGADQAGWLADLRLVAPDLRAALTFCLTPPPADPATGAALVWALSWYWSFDGAFAEAGRWIEAALAAGPHDLRTAARLRLASATHAESLGRLGDAERDAAAAAAAFTRLGEPRGEAESLLHVGTTRWVLGDLGGAAVAHEKAAALYRSAGDDAGTGIALVLRARTALEAADPASARRWLAEADGVLLRAGDAHLTALALEQSARCALFEGDLVEAERLASAAARSFEAVGYAEGLVASRLTLGRVRAAEGDAVGAATSYRDAAARAGELAHPAGVAEGLEQLAGLTAASGDPAAAAQLLGHAEGLRRRTGTPRTPLQDRGVRTLTAALDTALGAERERLAAAGRDQALTALLERVP